jgi:8-oxo-dGTP diphosphatase
MKVSDHHFVFCPRCRTRLELRDVGGRERPLCPGCGFVQYLNPTPGAAVVLFRGDRLCLVRRRFPPKEGQWSLPAGFMEFTEEIEETAVREVKEETNLDVRLTGLFAVHTGVLPPDRPVLLVVYTAAELGGELRAADDVDEVGFFPLDRLPGPIAFAAHRKVLAALREKRG